MANKATAKKAAAKKATAKKGVPAKRAKRGNGTSLNGERARDREVIDAAVHIFWEKGYANSSVQDVADALGMLKGSLYYYIDSKESLLSRIFEDSHREISEMTEAAAAAEGTAVERMARFLNDYAMWTLTHIERAALYSREWRYAGERTRALLSEQQRYYDRQLRALIQKGQAEGDLNPTIDPRQASLFIWAAFTALPDWHRPTDRMSAEEVAADYVQLALRAAGRSTAKKPVRKK